MAAYEALVQQSLPTIAAQVLGLYPAAADPAPWYAWADLLDDLTFACAARSYSRHHAANGNPTWRYVYTHVFDNPSAVYGAFHGADIRLCIRTAVVRNRGRDAALRTDSAPMDAFRRVRRPQWRH